MAENNNFTPDDDAPEETELVDVTEATKGLDLENSQKTTAPRQDLFPGGFVTIASLRERFSAFLIDTTVLFYLYWALGTIARRALYGSWDGPIPCYGIKGISFHAAFLIIVFLYYFIFEGVFFTTPGKFCRWISIRNKDTSYASMSSIFVRNFFRPLDYILPLLPIFLMELTTTHQRLGDVIAGTTVIKKGGEPPREYNTEKLASCSGRIISFIIDLLLVSILTSGYLLLLSPEAPMLSKWLLLFSPLVPLLYFLIPETLTETSPGKWLMGYTISHEDGTPLTFSGALIRTILRPFDTNPIGLATLWLSAKKQRMGDIAAETVVTNQGRKWPGLAALVCAIFVASTSLWLGLQNKLNFLSEDFKFNFIPSIEILGAIGGSPSQYTKPAIMHFRLAAGDANTIRTPPVFYPGETIYLIFDFYGYERVNRMVWVQEDLDVRYPDGSIALHQENIIDYHQIMSTSGGPIELSNNISLPPNAQAGVYKATVTIRDLFAHERVVEQQTFEVKAQ